MNDLYPYALKAFIRKPGPDLRLTSIRLVLFALGWFVLQFMFEKVTSYSSEDFGIFVYTPIAIFFTAFIWGFFERETKHLRFYAQAQLTADGIFLESKTISWTTISALKTGNVLGENIFNKMKFVGPKYSSGLNSYLQTESGDTYHFLFESYKDQSQFEKIMKDQYKRGSLKLTIVSDGLNLDNEAIQELKKAV